MEEVLSDGLYGRLPNDCDLLSQFSERRPSNTVGVALRPCQMMGVFRSGYYHKRRKSCIALLFSQYEM